MSKASKVTFEVPVELRELMDQHPEVNWSGVFRKAISRHADVLDAARQIVAEGEDRRILDLASKLREGVGARFRRGRRAHSS